MTTNLRLLNQWGPCPPDGFRYVFPEDGFLVHAWTFVDWLQLAKNHAQANGLPEPTEEAMEAQLCKTLPPGFCSYDDPNTPRTGTSLEWKDVLRGTQALVNWVAHGAQRVDQQEAERRALVCSRCYLNVTMSGCSTCQATVVKLAQGFKNKYNSSLKSCAVCKCALQLKVHFPAEILDRENESVKTQYPLHCWLNKNSENFRP